MPTTMNAIAPSARRRGSAAGFTLIEVLVSILVFSFGVLGVVGMQARLLQASTQNADRARASLLANEIVSTMWAKQTADITSLSDYAAWQRRVSTPTASGLPRGVGAVSKPDANGQVTVTVTWHPPSMADANALNLFTTTVAIQ
jgi:type IV pilus assembly protein PilV